MTKRCVPLLLSLIFLLTAPAGCRKNAPVDCLTALRAVCPEDGNAAAVHTFSAFLTDERERALLGELFCDDKPPGEWAGVKEAAIALGRGTNGYEVWILKSKHTSEKKRAKELLLRRIALLQSPDVERFLGEDYQTFIASAGVYEIGDLLCLLVTEDNERAAAQIEKILK